RRRTAPSVRSISSPGARRGARLTPRKERKGEAVSGDARSRPLQTRSDSRERVTPPNGTFLPNLVRRVASRLVGRLGADDAQAARTVAHRRQRRLCISARLGKAPWHFSQRVSRSIVWCERQAPVDSLTAWRVQPSQTHLPKVIAPP